jgi:hypothetical protein
MKVNLLSPFLLRFLPPSLPPFLLSLRHKGSDTRTAYNIADTLLPPGHVSVPLSPSIDHSLTPMRVCLSKVNRYIWSFVP